MLPQEFTQRLAQQFGESGKNNILAAFKLERLPTFRVNTLKTSDEKVMDVLRESQIMYQRIKTIPHAFQVKNRSDRQMLEHNLATDGHIYLQGLTSMLPPIILDAKPGESVLDLCAAPGSKTSQLAALMQGQGRVVACEENGVRFQKLMNTLRIQGAANVEAHNVDATLLHHEMAGQFNKVLADVPCTAEGRFNLNDKRSYSFWSQKNIVAHAKLQRRLLRSAVACLKEGGVLVYSTCTMAPEENELMIDWLLTEYPFMKPEVITIPFSPVKVHTHKALTLLPSADAEGFFVAKLVKNA